MKTIIVEKYKNIVEFTKDNIKYLITIVLASIIGGFLLNILLLLSSVFYINDIIMFITNELAILLSLCITPYIIFKKNIYKDLIFSENKILLTLLLVIPIICSLKFIDVEVSIHFMIIAISEEVLFREIYYQYFLGNIKSNSVRIINIVTMLTTSFVFATVIHMNENLFINIIVRFPLGILLFIIRDKLDLKSVIIFHWLYNIIVTFLL